MGARLVRDEQAGGWRVVHVYQNDPDYPESLSPLVRPGVGVRDGDVLLSINGVATSSVSDPEKLLRAQAGKQVLLEVKSSSDKKPRQVIVKPITTEQEADLRYDEWEYTRRLETEKLGQGQIGYVHLRAMGSGNIAEWARNFYPVVPAAGADH